MMMEIILLSVKIQLVTTGEDGTLTVGNLSWGSYYFIEKEAPEGYIKSDDYIAFMISRNALTAEVEAGNEEKTASVTLKKTDIRRWIQHHGCLLSIYTKKMVLITGLLIQKQ